MQERIVEAWARAKPAHIDHGMRWYAEANRLAAGIADATACPMHTVVGVMAAVSPSNRWERNVRDARELCAALDPESITVCTYGAQKRKALRILDGEDPLDVLGGRKVRAFYQCVLDPRSHHVVVDRHAWRVATGRHDETPSSLSPRVYAEICDAYREAAGVIGGGVLPMQVQAATWVAFKEEYRR